MCRGLFGQGLNGFVYLLEMELADDFVHELGYLVGAEVADTAFVGVAYVFVGGEVAGFDVEAYLLVGVAEGGALGYEAVDVLDGEHEVVAWVVEYVCVDLHLAYDVGAHLQAVAEFMKCGEEDFLDYLQVTEVSAGQIVHDEHYLLGEGLELVALGSGELEDVGVLLVGHDA